jgi:hypothetical protein
MSSSGTSDVEREFGQTLVRDVGCRASKGTDLPLSYDRISRLPVPAMLDAPSRISVTSPITSKAEIPASIP